MTSLGVPFFYLLAVALAVLAGLEINGLVEFVSYVRDGEQAYRGTLRAVVFYGWLMIGSLYCVRAFSKSDGDEQAVQTYAGVGPLMGLITLPIIQFVALMVDFLEDRQVDWGLQGTISLFVLMVVAWIAFFLTSKILRPRS